MARQTLTSPPLEAPHIDLLVARADLEAERTIAWTRIALGVTLMIVFTLTVRRFAVGDMLSLAEARSISVALWAFLATGFLSLFTLRRGYFRRWMSFVFVTVDAILIGLSLAGTMQHAELPANYIIISPAVWAIPVLLAVGTLRFRPGVQIWFLASLLISLSAAAWSENFEVFLSSAPPETITRFLALPPYIVRVVMLTMAGAVTAFVMVRARRLLISAVTEALNRATLTRFLPSEVAPLVASSRFAELRRGRRQHAVIMFVDIRGSTSLAEHMDPHRLSVFLASFRRRVMAAAQSHGGVIDKFIGDGAMIVFGLPEPAPDDASRALACGKDILARIGRWNAKRHFDPPLSVGIGVHVGEVYFGVVGDRDRMELTVIGDAVNVAARLEQATKDYHVPLIASEAVIREACATTMWCEIGREPLRGRVGNITLFAATPEPPRLPTSPPPVPLSQADPSTPLSASPSMV